MRKRRRRIIEMWVKSLHFAKIGERVIGGEVDGSWNRIFVLWLGRNHSIDVKGLLFFMVLLSLSFVALLRIEQTI